MSFTASETKEKYGRNQAQSNVIFILFHIVFQWHQVVGATSARQTAGAVQMPNIEEFLR